MKIINFETENLSECLFVRFIVLEFIAITFGGMFSYPDLNFFLLFFPMVFVILIKLEMILKESHGVELLSHNNKVLFLC